jgi:hypothetical protein
MKVNGSATVQKKRFPIRLVDSAMREERMAYALFYHDQCIGAAAPTELEAWRRALRSGLITDIPVADEQGGQVLPRGLHVKQVAEDFAPQPEWKLPPDIS